VGGGIFEQVVGFSERDLGSDRDRLQGHSSPYGLFVQMLRSRGYSTTALRLNMSCWVSEPPRDRLYIVYLHARLGGARGIEHIEAAVRDHNSGRGAGKW